MSDFKPPYAEQVNYWQTGKSAPDTWLQKAETEIKRVKGTVLGRGFLDYAGKAVFMMAFQVGEDQYKIMWPVLQTRSRAKNAPLSAQRQAATMLYYDIKAKCMVAKVMGARKAFFQYLVLPDGRVASDVATPELAFELNNYLQLPIESEATPCE